MYYILYTTTTALAGKQDKISDLETIRSGAASGATAVQPADMTTALAAKLDTTTYNTDQAALQASIAAVADAGAKNVLHTLRASGSSATGLTYILNTDGTYSLGGTTTSPANISALCTLADIPESYVGKKVKLTGAYSADIRLSVYNGNVQTEYTDNGDGVEFDVTSAMRTTPYTIRLLVNGGTDCSGKLIKPMLRLASIPGDSYQQYAPTNRQLYEMILALQ